MEITRMLSSETALYPRALALYRSSFPYHEQREEASQLAIFDHPEYYFGLIREEGLFIGLMLYWETETFRYVEHFCIQPELRGQGYGHRALAQLCGDRKTVILEIDPPVTEIAVRRKAFYERAGFSENPYSHVHPSYHEGYAGHELVIMSYPGAVTQDQYNEFSEYLSGTVMWDAYPR